MDSPLEYDQKVKKDFGIINDFEGEPEAFLGFVRAQYGEIAKFLQRERVELILSEAQAGSDIEALAASAKAKVAEHRQNIKGVVASLTVLKQFIEELENDQKEE